MENREYNAPRDSYFPSIRFFPVSTVVLPFPRSRLDADNQNVAKIEKNCHRRRLTARKRNCVGRTTRAIYYKRADRLTRIFPELGDFQKRFYNR